MTLLNQISSFTPFRGNLRQLCDVHFRAVAENFPRGSDIEHAWIFLEWTSLFVRFVENRFLIVKDSD